MIGESLALIREEERAIWISASRSRGEGRARAVWRYSYDDALGCDDGRILRRERRRSLVVWASFRAGRECSFADEDYKWISPVHDRKEDRPL